MYVNDGASFKQKLNPSSVNSTQICKNDWLNPNAIQQTVIGMLTNITAFRRPILSLIGPLNKLPIGWAILAQPAKILKKKHMI